MRRHRLLYSIIFLASTRLWSATPPNTNPTATQNAAATSPAPNTSTTVSAKAPQPNNPTATPTAPTPNASTATPASAPAQSSTAETSSAKAPAIQPNSAVPVAAETTAPSKTPVSEELRLSRELAAEVGKKDQLWFQGETEQEFLGLFKVETTGSPFGLLLLLPDRDQLADAPGLVHQLRIELPEYGWSSLAVSLPSFDRSVTDNAWAHTVAARPDRALLTDSEFEQLAEQARIAAADKAKAEEEAKQKAAKNSKKDKPAKTDDTTQKAAKDAKKTEVAADCTPEEATTPDPKTNTKALDQTAPATTDTKTSDDKTPPKKAKKTKKLPPCPKKIPPPPLPIVKTYQDPAALEQAYQQQLGQRFDQLLTQASVLSKGKLVLLATGANGGLWLNYLLQRLANNAGKAPIDALILVNAYQPGSQIQADQAERLCRLRIPILDLSTDHPELILNAGRERRDQCRRQQKTDYRYQVLPIDAELLEQVPYMSSVIRGWLKRLR